MTKFDRRVRATPDEIVAYVEEHGPVSEAEVAAGLGISGQQAREKLDALVGKGRLIYSDYSFEGYGPLRRPDWRYGTSEE